MMPNLRLLVVDDDFQRYDTPLALEKAIAQLSQEGTTWSCKLSAQHQVPSRLEEERYDAVLIDNDFGKGIGTLAEILVHGIPVGYITAYDLDGLKRQYDHVEEARQIAPDLFADLNVTLIQKRGNNVGKDLTMQALEQQIYSFLKDKATE